MSNTQEFNNNNQGEIVDLDEELSYCAANNSMNDFFACLDQGANINAIDGPNSLPLWAVSHSAVDVAVWLAENARRLNINLDFQDSFLWETDEDCFDHLFGKGCRPLDIEDRF